MKLRTLEDSPRIVSTVAKLKYNWSGVYFLYDLDGVLQYIGQSGTVRNRVRNHSHFRGVDISNWRVEVIRAGYGNRKYLERLAITTLKPPMNKVFLVPGTNHRVRRPVSEIFPD